MERFAIGSYSKEELPFLQPVIANFEIPIEILYQGDKVVVSVSCFYGERYQWQKEWMKALKYYYLGYSNANKGG